MFGAVMMYVGCPDSERKFLCSSRSASNIGKGYFPSSHHTTLHFVLTASLFGVANPLCSLSVYLRM